jgi:uncharacterized protein
MSTPDFEGAKRYALKQLEAGLSPKLLYHSLSHTRDDVAPAAERLALMEGVSSDEIALLLTAAYFHDIGFVVQNADHEAVSIRIASEILPGFGFAEAQISRISGIIQATQLPQTPHNLLEEIIADADLDVLGREDFYPRSQDLRVEMAAFGRPHTTEAWYTNQVSFLRNHRYFTASARLLRDAKKQQNLEDLQTLLEKLHSSSTLPIARRDDPLSEPAIPVDEAVHTLQSTNIFVDLPAEMLTEIARVIRPVTFQGQEIIFNKGDFGDCMYIIVAGVVRIYDGLRTLAHLRSGDIFGEMALLDAVPRLVSAAAIEPVDLFQLDKGQFQNLMARQPDAARGVIRALSQHLRRRGRNRT